MDEFRVAAIVGSLREKSNTRIACDRALAAAAEYESVETDLLDLRELTLPVFNANHREAGDAPELKRRIRDADSVVFGSPNYHSSYSSALKNALDYCGFDEFEHTTVGLLTVAGGSFPGSALEHMRSVARGVGAWVVPHQVAVANAYDRFEDGRLVDEDVAERVDTLGERMVEYARIEPAARTVDKTRNVEAGD